MSNYALYEINLRSFEELPLIFVSEFSRFCIPQNMEFPYFHVNPLKIDVPDAVSESLVNVKGRFSNFLKCFFSRKDELVKGVRHLGNFMEYDSGVWVRNNVNGLVCLKKDEKEIIFEQLDPYTRKLEALVQEEVLPSELLPDLPRYGSELIFQIPGSGYDLIMGTDLLVRLGWFEQKFIEEIEGLADSVKSEDLYKVMKEKVYEKVVEDNKDVPIGYTKLSLYITGLQPKDVFNMAGWTDLDRFSFKFAEFLYQGVIKI